MKKIEEGLWVYKGFFIERLEHPKLYGKYEVYKEGGYARSHLYGGVLLGRAKTLKEAKNLINEKKKWMY